MAKKHDHILGLCSAALTTARAPSFDIQVGTEVRNDLEKVLLKCGFLEGAPFEWVTISFRYGIKNDDEPHYEPINEKYGDLPLSIELDINLLKDCTRDELREAFETSALKALIHAGQRFDLKYRDLQNRLSAIVANSSTAFSKGESFGSDQ